MKSYQIPFDAQGNLMHFAKESLGSYYRPHEWQNVKPLHLTLDIDRIASGRSAKYAIWTDEHGHEFPMFMTDLQHLLKHAIIDSGRVTDIFEGCKRGQNYGIRLSR